MKHKIITEETKTKIAKTKSENGRNKIIEGAKSFKQKPSENNLKVASHRKHNFISIDEYQNLIKEGKTTLEVCKITSKHLVYFYNAMLKGRITLSKEDFETMYNNGSSLDEIAKESNTPREYITQLRNFYGIKRKGATFQKRLKNEKPLTQEAKNIIIGSLLGDGHITKGGYFSEKHSPAQFEYLQWKATFFPHITTDKSWDHYKTNHKIKDWEGITETHSYRTTVHSWLIEMEKLWYKDIDGKRTKVIPDQIDEWMNPQVLAVWFMDDGNTDWKYRKKVKEYKNIKPNCYLCTDSFDNDSINKIINILLIKLCLPCKINSRNRLSFNVKATKTIMEIMKPFTHTSMMYKIEEEVYRKQINAQ
tara:strand:- start:57847 stop:58935 length:1089 start_codon:yes stop_codon:yes gene_type:complete